MAKTCNNITYNYTPSTISPPLLSFLYFRVHKKKLMKEKLLAALKTKFQYEDFTRMPEVRNKLAKVLKLQWDERNIQSRSRQGRGSTFEGWLDVGSREDTQRRYTQITSDKVRELYEGTLKARPDLIKLYQRNWTVTGQEADYIQNHLVI